MGWSITSSKGISLSICMQKVLMEENSRPIVEHQHQLNPNMKEVVRTEVLKLLDVGMIYLIFGCPLLTCLAYCSIRRFICYFTFSWIYLIKSAFFFQSKLTHSLKGKGVKSKGVSYIKTIDNLKQRKLRCRMNTAKIVLIVKMVWLSC